MAPPQESIPPEPVDFFISYTGSDEQEAEWIAWQLEAAGYHVLFAKWDFRPGHNFVLRMQEAVVRARKTIIVLSHEYEEAFFTRTEWAAEFSNDPTGQNRCLIPVRIKSYKLLGMFKSIVYIDLVDCFRNGNKDEARRRLLNGVSLERAKPASEPIFPKHRER